MNRNFLLPKPRSLLRQTVLVAGWLMIVSQPASVLGGFVNIMMTNGYNFVANPLDAAPNNSITNVIPRPPDGTRVWLWNVTNQVFDPPATFVNTNIGWSQNLFLPPGRGFVLHPPVSFLNTFVGAVMEGSLTNFVAGSNRLSLLGFKVPISGPLASTLLFPGSDGDVVSTYPSVSQQYLDGYTFLANHGWFDPNGVVSTNGPVITIGSAFFVRHRGADTNWIFNFFIPLGASLTVGGPPPPDIAFLTIQNGIVTLHLSETNRPFNVQFSTDRLSWTTLATNQMGGTWIGNCPPTTTGFFQLVSP